MNTSTMTRNHIVAAIENLALALKGAELTHQTQAVSLIESNIRTLSATLNDLDERVKAESILEAKKLAERQTREQLIDQIEHRYEPLRQVYWDSHTGGRIENLADNLHTAYTELMDAIEDDIDIEEVVELLECWE